MLCGRIKPSVKYNVDSMEWFLKKCFPTADHIVLSDSDDENVEDPESLLVMIEEEDENAINDEIVKSLQQESTDDNIFVNTLESSMKDSVNKVSKQSKTRRRSICVPSIAEYSLKTQKLAPSSAYAKKSKGQKPTLSINYKETKPNVKVQFDPKEEAIKLNKIKEKIYCKQFLKMDDAKKDIKVERKDPTKDKDEKNISLAVSSSETKLMIEKPRTFRKRKRAYFKKSEAIELSESE